MLRVGQDLNLNTEMIGTSRVDAVCVEIRSGQNGTDVRNEGDTGIRSRQIGSTR